MFRSHPDWTTAILCWLALQYRILPACKDYRCVLMRPLDFIAKVMLCELHWLLVYKRVHYKLLLLTYKMLNGSAHEYLVNHLQDYCPTRVLRSTDQNLLSMKKTCIKIGDSSFTVAALVLWNTLPCHIKKARTIDCFKSMIKTNLFRL